MIKIKQFLLLPLVLFLGCEKPNEPIKAMDSRTKWRLDIPSQSSFNVIRNPLIYRNSLIIPDDGAGIILCVDKITGEEIWRWNEAEDEHGVDGFRVQSYIHNNILIIGERNLTYGIDAETGETLWKHQKDLNSVPFFNGVEEKYVIREWIFEEKIWINVGDIRNGETQSIYEFERDDDFKIGGNLPLYFEWGGNEYITFSKIKFGFDSNNTYVEDQWLHLYNISDDQLEWVSDTIPLEFNVSGIAGLRPVFHEGKILLANDAIYSYDIADGSLAWKKYYGNSFVLSTHLSADYGRVYGNNASGFMVSLDVHTGQQYFNVQTGGSASRIELNDGKAYISSLTGNGENRMEIRDAYNGSLIKTIEAPFKEPGNNRNFDEVITVDPETGYIYAADHQQILCFDPEL